VTYPPNYGILSNFTLSLINHDRMRYGLSPVSLSPISVGQQHADSMVYFGYFNHWDPQGYKPYVRYTLMGGTGFVEENIALGWCTHAVTNASAVSITACDTQTMLNSLANSESEMMYNDAGCCKNGHRANILNPYHNRVSIGVAYDSASQSVVLVQDFENYYMDVSLYANNGIVAISGETKLGFNISSSEIVVAFDRLPAPINVSALHPISCYRQQSSCVSELQSNECGSFANYSFKVCTLTKGDYPESYDPGTSLGAIFRPCPLLATCPPKSSDGRIAAYANAWELSNGTMVIGLSLASFTRVAGPGVYTLYFFPTPVNSNETIMSISFSMGS
jgi:cysteine-rich secretory family protein